MTGLRHLLGSLLDRAQSRRRKISAAWQRWALLNLPAGVVARPFEGFMGMVCLVSGAAIATGLSAPVSAENVLVTWMYYSWSAVLVLGGLMMQFALSSIRWLAYPQYELSRVAEYQFALRLLGIGSGIWAVVVVAYSGWNAIVSAGFAVLFAGTCVVRLLTVGSRI